jgi:hypothetical protein
MSFQFELRRVRNQIIDHYVSILTSRIQLGIIVFKEHAGHSCFVEGKLMKHVESTPLCVICIGFVWLSIGYVQVEHDDGSRGVANGQIVSRDL